MKGLSILSAALVSTMLLGGCATTGGGKSPGARSKETKPLTATDVIARFEKVTNGKEGRKKHPSMTMKGTVSIVQFNMDGPFVRYAMAPDSSVATVQIMGMALSNGCHKGACWTQQPGAGTSLLTGQAAALQLQQADYAQWEHLDRYYSSLEIVEPTDGTQSANYKIKAVKKDGIDYYEFSKESGLLVGGVIDGETAQGRMQVSIAFNNYKNFDGMMIPTESIQTTPQATLKIVINEVSFEPLSDSNFAQPK